MKGIIVGSIVLCKMLVSEPNIQTDSNQNVNVSAGNKNIFAQEIVAPQIEKELNDRNISVNSSKSKISEIIDSESEEGVEIIIGEVVNIVESKRWKKNTSTGKYFEEIEKSFFVKNDKYHTIKFKETSCGLKSDWVDGKSLNKKLDKSKKKINKKQTKISKNDQSDTVIEEYLIVPVDYKLKDGEYEVTDKVIKNKILKVVKDEKGIDLINKKNEQKETIPVISYDEDVISDEKKEEIVDNNPFADEEIKKDKVVKSEPRKALEINNDEIPKSIFSSFEDEELPAVVVEKKKEVIKKKPKKESESLWSKVASKFKSKDNNKKNNKKIVNLNKEKKVWKEFLSVLFLEF